MTTKHFISVLTLMLLGTLAYGQKVEYSTDLWGKKIEYSTDQPREWKSDSEMQPGVPYYRIPKRPKDVHSFVELKSMINNIQDWPKRNTYDLSFIGVDSDNKRMIDHKKKPHFEIYDDRLEMNNVGSNKKLVIWFTDLRDQNIRVILSRGNDGVYEIPVLELRNMRFYDNVDWLAGYLYAIKFFLYEKPQIVADSIQFITLAAKYREMEVKPTVAEEQRKYIIQANSFTNDKLYEQAIEVYKKALAIDPVAYPAAYYNMALLLAEKKYFEEAIKNMKKYLLLVPDASDARAAQDKIYEWER